MKIAFIGGRDIHSIGGIENYMYNLATELVKLGVEPIVFCESDHNGEEWVNGFRVIHQKSPKSHLICKPWLGLKATIKVIRKFKDVDVIHYNAWPPAMWTPLAAIYNKKCVLMGHGLEWRHSKYRSFQKRLIKFMEAYTTHINPNLIMCSTEQKVYYKRRYNRDVIVIPTATNLPEIYDEEGVLNKYKLTTDRYFLFMGRIGKVKNPDFLIKAFNTINLDDYKLVIAGGESDEKQYIEFVHDVARDNKNIVFTGPVFGKEKSILYQNSFCFCIPSTSEGLSIALLEAMSYKLPIIASSIPGNQEVLEKDKAVWVRPESVEDLERAYKECIAKGDEWKEIVEYNYNKVRDNYVWDKIAEKYLNVIRQLK